MRPGLLAALLAAAGLVAGCESGVRTATESPLDEYVAPEEQDVPALTAPQVQLFLRDSTLARIDEGREVYLYHAEDGTLIGQAQTEAGGEVVARGTWGVDDAGRLCHGWPTAAWEATSEACFEVYRYDDDYVLLPEGGEPKRYLRAAGDVETLL